MTKIMRNTGLMVVAIVMSVGLSLESNAQEVIMPEPDGTNVDCRCKNRFIFFNRCKAAEAGSVKADCSDAPQCWDSHKNC